MSQIEMVTVRGEHLPNVREYLAGVRRKWDTRRGYSAEFAERHDQVIQNIVENPDRIILVVSGLDAICNCGACPRKGPHCEAPQLIEKDERVAREHGIVLGRSYRAEELLRLLTGKRSRKNA